MNSFFEKILRKAKAWDYACGSTREFLHEQNSGELGFIDYK
jgi:hypothetical protein